MKSRPNIYHIVLDGFSNLVFQDAIKDLNRAEAFNGFTHFIKNRANYNDTFASMASVYTGHLFRDGSFRKWVRSKFSNGLLMKMDQHGYQINNYNVEKKFHYRDAVIQKFQADMLNRYLSPTSHLSKLLKTFNRFANNILTERIGKGLRLLLSKSLSPFDIRLHSMYAYPSFSMERFLLSESVLALPMMLDFIENEKNRHASGQYNLIHAMLPHSPYNWTRAFVSKETDYMEQVYCCINLMTLIINELKRLRRFSNSLIIFHADHGWSDLDVEYPFLNKTPAPVLKKIQSSIRKTPSRFLNRTHSLLLIKPPGQNDNQPIEVSDKLTQLVDIAATISDLTGWKLDSKDGASVFSDFNESDREIHLFAGLHKYNKLGLKCDFGTHFRKGHLAHFSLSQGNHWKILPDLPISW